MTVIPSFPSTILVAIDSSKHRHEILIGVTGKKRQRRLTTASGGKPTSHATQYVFDYIETFDNPKRKHTNNGMLSPVASGYK